jgi:hypothetical protein
LEMAALAAPAVVGKVMPRVARVVPRVARVVPLVPRAVALAEWRAPAGPLECRIIGGQGDPRDPCGCPCCWANDCPNTDATCCRGFCKGADQGRGCCGQ